MNIPQDAYNEIDFMLGSIEECKFLSPILKKHGIDPNGGWLDIEQVPEEVIEDIYSKLFTEN